MTESYIEQIMSLFKNKTLNALGVERSLYQRIQDRDITGVIGMMQENEEDVDNALREYNIQTHAIMKRPDKIRKKKGDSYITEKLPRNWQHYINEVELFFLLGNPIVWSKNYGDDECYTLFQDFLKEIRFDSLIRKAKRLAGAETESAIVFHIERKENNELDVMPFVAARSTGYKLRTLIDQYGRMSAIAIGYNLKDGNKTIEHWDIYTKDFIFYCKSGIGWDVKTYPNGIGKIPAVYFHQQKSWAGAEPRIHREEMLDSKTADSNNYFADPIATATADVLQALSDPNKPGKCIQLAGANSKFEYVNPPTSSATRESEKADLEQSILFDTQTPDFSFSAMRGMGTLTGVAIRNSMILGYIKRANRMETWGEMVDRLKNIIITILKARHPDKAKALDELDIEFEFGEPFQDDKRAEWNAMQGLYASGLVSLETAIKELALTDAPEDEIDRLYMAHAMNVQEQKDLLEMKEEAKNQHGDDQEPKDEE